MSQPIERQQFGGRPADNQIVMSRPARIFLAVELLLGVFPDHPILERTSMNSWDDQKVRDALAKNGQKKVVVSGLWTEVCVTWPTIEMLGITPTL